MPYRRKHGRLAAALVAAGFGGLLSQNAHASGFALMEQNGSGLGNAYAGQAAAAEDASTIFFNPAGMTYIKGRQLVGAVNGILTSGEFNNNGSTPNFFQPLGGDGGDSGDFSAVPAAYFSWEAIPSQLWLGIGIGVPFGLKTEYDEDWMGRFRAIKSEVKTININPSVAWKVNDSLSLGFGVNAQKIDATLTQAQTLGGAGEARVKIEGDDWAWGWNAGLLLQVNPATRLGISYRSKIDYELEGDFTSNTAFIPSDGIQADLEVPDTLSIGLSHQLTPKIELLVDYTWTGWDSIQNVDVMRTSTGALLQSLELRFDDSWRIGVGANYQMNDSVKLRFGVAYDRTPVDDEFRTPRLPDEDRIWFAVGAQYLASKQLALDFGYAYIMVEDAEVNLTNSSPSLGTLRGNYDADVHIFAIQGRYSF